ncbi:TrmH family RNA methyltransferase [Sediminibacterium roseum]|uniref:TrmH family RNA methyltransferase n=1 Tax=Sediminibacterium roseum TaxID=1978412 RepID=UPI001ED97C98|nr:RNA methyltransferase [Sediminibacterium roseum]
MELTPERKAKLLNVLSKRQAGLTVVMENVDDPHNISAVMRTCEAVGIQDIFVLTTKIHPHRQFGPRSSSSAAKWLTVHSFTDTKECVAELRKRYSKILTTHLGEDSITLHNIDFTESIALVFGNEHDGVSEEIRAMADGNFIIPQMGIIQSLNISVACAVTIYEAMRQKQIAGHYDQPSLSEERREALMKDWSIPRKQKHDRQAMSKRKKARE